MIVGISTFLSVVEVSRYRITCEIGGGARWWGEVRDFLLPVWPIGGESDTKFSLLAQNASKMGISGVLGEFCTGWARRGCEPGEFCTDTGPACGTKFSLLGLLVGVSAKKFALRVQNGPKSAVCGVLGEFFRENTV